MGVVGGHGQRSANTSIQVNTLEEGVGAPAESHPAHPVRQVVLAMTRSVGLDE